MSETLGAWLRRQRLARNWSAAEMGRRLQQAAKSNGDHTVPSTAILIGYIYRWEADKMGITERYRLHYCTALGIQPDDFGPPQPTQEAQDELQGVAVPGHPDAPEARAAPPFWPTDVSGYGETRTGHNTVNRTRQQLRSDLTLSRLMAMIAQESLDFGEWIAMSEVADATIERYATQVRHLSKDFEYAPPFPILLETRRLRDRVASHLRGHQQLEQARDLYLIAAQVCGLLAWMSGDLGSYRAADTHAWTALMCAEQAGHDGARTWVRATQAKLAYWDGRYSESAQLAEDGLRYRCTDSAGVILALFQSRALAKIGKRAEAMQALAHAEAERDRNAGANLVGGVWGLTSGRFHGLAASTHMLLNQPTQALAEASRAITHAESTRGDEQHIYSEMLARMDQAEAHLRQPDLDAASVALRPVLNLLPDSRIDPVIQRLKRLDAALAAPSFAGSQQAQQLQEEIETYCDEAIPHQIGA